MQTIESWRRFWKNVDSLKVTRENRDYLDLYGSFKPRQKYQSAISNEVYHTAATIEKILIAAFLNFNVEAIQSPAIGNPTRENERYVGVVFVSDKDKIIASIDMHLWHPKVVSDGETRYLPADLIFQSYLPFGEYKEESIESLRQIWPYVKSIDFKSENKMLHDVYENASIFFTNNGKILKRGREVISDLGLELKPLYNLEHFLKSDIKKLKKNIELLIG